MEKRETKYGIGQAAKTNSDAEVTDRQEYDKCGLPQTDKYSVDKDKVCDGMSKTTGKGRKK